ncbi:hypothetical protein K438DRAFT_1936840 [Mycena galopus ATCC 62051]|nr:hypothetical protein K438DRAFT_1936840 [Mycena galopus ATCC 62051]
MSASIWRQPLSRTAPGSFGLDWAPKSALSGAAICVGGGIYNGHFTYGIFPLPLVRLDVPFCRLHQIAPNIENFLESTPTSRAAAVPVSPLQDRQGSTILNVVNTLNLNNDYKPDFGEWASKTPKKNLTSRLLQASEGIWSPILRISTSLSKTTSQFKSLMYSAFDPRPTTNRKPAVGKESYERILKDLQGREARRTGTLIIKPPTPLRGANVALPLSDEHRSQVSRPLTRSQFQTLDGYLMDLSSIRRFMAVPCLQNNLLTYLYFVDLRAALDWDMQIFAPPILIHLYVPGLAVYLACHESD